MEKSFIRTAQGTFNLMYVTMILHATDGIVLHFVDGTEVSLHHDEGERLTKLLPHILALDLIVHASTTVRVAPVG